MHVQITSSSANSSAAPPTHFVANSRNVYLSHLIRWRNARIAACIYRNTPTIHEKTETQYSSSELKTIESNPYRRAKLNALLMRHFFHMEAEKKTIQTHEATHARSHAHNTIDSMVAVINDDGYMEDTCIYVIRWNNNCAVHKTH